MKQGDVLLLAIYGILQMTDRADYPGKTRDQDGKRFERGSGNEPRSGAGAGICPV